MALQTPSHALVATETYPTPVVERSTKSRFRSLFSRKKQDRSGKESPRLDITTPLLASSTNPDQALPSPPPPPPPPPPKTPAVKRSRSISWTTRSRSTTRTPKAPVLPLPHLPDALPFVQAFAQSTLHGSIDVPSDHTIRRDQARRNSSIFDATTLTDLPAFRALKQKQSADEDTISLHRRSWSISSHSALTSKVFVLVNRKYILQYDTEGSNDRLPEKSLELGPDSIAVASDAVAGKHWVLRISADGSVSEENLPNQTPKSDRSRRYLRDNGLGKNVRDLLLVFETAKLFDTWLTAVRKHIDSLGGLEPRLDPSSIEQELQRHQPLQKLNTNPEPHRLSQSYSHLSVGKSQLPPALHHTETPQPPPQVHHNTRVPASTTSSARGSAEKTRNPSFSDTQSMATTPGTSVDGSAASNSGSPAHDRFPVDLMPKPLTVKGPVGTAMSVPVATVKTHNKKSDSIRTAVIRSEGRKSSSVDPTMLWSYANAHKMGPNTEVEQIPEAPSSPDMTEHDSVKPSQPETSSGKTIAERRAERKASEVDISSSRPMSTIAPLPAPGALKKPSRYRKDGTSDVPNFSFSRPSTSHDRTTTFSLFPKRNSSLEQSHGRVMHTPVFSPNGSFYTPRESPGGSSEIEYPFPLVSPRPGSQQGASLQRPKSAHDKKMSLGMKDHHRLGDGVDRPPRSPEVTEAHFASNFGTRPISTVPSKSFDASRWSKSTIDVSSATPRLDSGVLHRRLSPQKSLPNVMLGAGLALGPPPSGPLPPVPSLSASSSPRFLNGHHSHSTNGQHGHRYNHSHGKSSVSSKRSASAESSTKPSPHHVRGQSSISSVASVSTIGTGAASPNKFPSRHTKKLSSVSSVGSLGSVSGWIAASTPGGFLDAELPPASAMYGTPSPPAQETSHGIDEHSSSGRIDTTRYPRRPSTTSQYSIPSTDHPSLPTHQVISPSSSQQEPSPPGIGVAVAVPMPAPQGYHHNESGHSRKNSLGHARSRSWASMRSQASDSRRTGPDGATGYTGTPF